VASPHLLFGGRGITLPQGPNPTTAIPVVATVLLLGAFSIRDVSVHDHASDIRR